jgi:hypothetical protein
VTHEDLLEWGDQHGYYPFRCCSCDYAGFTDSLGDTCPNCGVLWEEMEC